MKIQSIEKLKLHLSDNRTRICIDEVLSCFYSKNMRSAVVMLYVTTISDVYYKLCDLVEIYNDTTAKAIKDNVEQEWKNNPTSPKWETEIIKKCYQEKRILDKEGYIHLSQLQSERNLCAHPVIDASKELYNPGEATVQGLIINMLVDILCKPSFLAKSFFDAFTEDIERSAENFPTEKELVNFIKIKYIDKIDNKQEEYAIFRKLWKLVFKSNDERCKKNRQNNFAILSLLYQHNTVFFNKKIEEEKEYYSAGVNLGKRSCLTIFIKFLNDDPAIYQHMSQDFKLSFKNKVNSDKEYKAISFCLSENIANHLPKIEHDINYQTANYIYEYIKKNEGEASAIDFIIDLYGDSNSYDCADMFFDNLVLPILPVMTEKQLVHLVKKSNNNSQIYDRRKFPNTRYEIRRFLSKKNPSFDYSPYTNFEKK